MSIVSVVMPAYNCEKFIEQAVRSVLSQTFTDWELIVVDDCSDDETANIVKGFADFRVRIIENNENLGGAASRNLAIRLARGRYIAFLDADDTWERDKLQTQLSFMQSQNVAFCFSGYKVIYEGSPRVDMIKVPEKVGFTQLLKHNYIGCLTAVYDTWPYGKIYMPLVKKRQDFALWLEILKKCDFAYSVPDALGSYRVRPGTLSSSKADALKYYWRVLRDVGQCGLFSAFYNLSAYLMIVYIKKRFPKLYNSHVINSLR